LENVEETTFQKMFTSFVEELECTDIQYCVIGNYEKLPYETENDVDFWVDDLDLSLTLLLKSAKPLGLKLYMHNKTANGTNNYFYRVHGEKVDVVKIDLMSETAYKSIIPLVSSDTIKDNREIYRGFYVANAFVEGVMHLLYPLVSFSIVKQKYREKLTLLSADAQFSSLLGEVLGNELGGDIQAMLEDESWDEIEKTSPKVKQYFIVATLTKLTLKRVLIFAKFFRTILARVFKKNGITIAFTGIDGAGKSSIKQHIIDNSDKYFSKGRVAEFYWRPFLLPRLASAFGVAGQREAYDDTGRRLVKQDQLFLSVRHFFKYAYYVADFILGQSKYFICVHTGGVAVFDRYHFDNIVYPERFGFSMNKSIMRFFDRWVVPQPDILFYFTAKTESLYDRKRELGIDEINSQKELYNREMIQRGGVKVIQTNCSFDDSVREVLAITMETASRRYSNERFQAKDVR
jgi:thymidylate kinase